MARLTTWGRCSGSGRVHVNRFEVARVQHLEVFITKYPECRYCAGPGGASWVTTLFAASIAGVMR